MKTGAWLRGGRGKIAGMVAQKSSDGKGTVLRELVVPKNPQTVDQMATRLAFGTVTQAAAQMLPIIGQTFKGQNGESLNRRRFVALNVGNLKAQAISQYEGGDVSALFRGKSSTALIPNPYIISEGSLNLPSTLQFTVDDGALVQGAFVPFTLVVGTTYKCADVIASILGIDASMQVTLVSIGVDINENNYEAANGGFIRNAEFFGRRIVFNTESEFTYTDGMTLAALKTALARGLNSEKTSTSIFDWVNTYTELEDNVVTFGENLLDACTADYNSYNFVAGAFILSKNDGINWDYSSSKMTFVGSKPNYDPAYPTEYNGLSFNDALIDYLGAEAASKLYTRKGGLINDI